MVLRKYVLFLNGKKIYTKKLKESDAGQTFPHTIERDFVPDTLPKEKILDFSVTVPGTTPPPPPPPPPPPGHECPQGQHWDEAQQKCVDDVVTPPPPPPPPGNIFRIGHIGDTHGNQKGVELLKTREKCDFVLHSGDITDDEQTDDGYIGALSNVGLVYGTSAANSQGNHESAEEGGEEAQADMEAAFPILKETRWLQFYHVRNVVIIINNTQISGYSQLDSVASKHVMDSLTKAKGLVDSGAADWIFFMQHKPMYVMQGGHDPEYNFRYNHHAAMDAAGVDIWVSGHVHNEQRTKPLLFGGTGTNVPPIVNDKMKNGAHDFTVTPHGIICCQNGSSTKSHSLGESLNAWTVWAEDNGDSFTVFEIDGKNLTGKYIDIDSGAIRHEFKVTKGEGGTTPPPPPPPPVECPPGQHLENGVCVPDVVNPPPPPPPPPGEVDAFGMKMLFKPTGKKVAMEEGADHANGKRYNVNHEYENYIMQGYFKLGQGQDKINHKGDGPNHGGCTEIGKFQCLWYEFDINLNNGKFELQYEMPHPENNNVPDSKCEHVETVGKLSAGQWIGWACAYYWGADGLRHMKAFVDKNPFDAAGKPLNNWQEGIYAIEKGQIVSGIKIPRDMQAAIKHEAGLESEIRMNNGTSGDTAMKNVWVFEIVPPTA